MDAVRTLVQTCDVRDFAQVEYLVAAASPTPASTTGTTCCRHLTGVFHGCRATLPQLLARRGGIINVASASGLGAD